MADPDLRTALVDAMVDAMVGDWFSVSLVQHKSQREIMAVALAAALRAAADWPVPHKLVGRNATTDMLVAWETAIPHPEQTWVRWNDQQIFESDMDELAQKHRAMFDAAEGVKHGPHWRQRND